MTQTRITTEAPAVTGIGCLCAAGADLEACTSALFGTRATPAPPRRFATAHDPPFPVFELPDSVIDALPAPKGTDGKTPEEWTRNPVGTRQVLLTARLTLAAAGQALADAKLTPETLSGVRVGVCVGTSTGCTMNDEPFYAASRTGGRPDMAPIRRYLDNNPASLTARAFGLRGPLQTVVNACASGSDAIGIAAGWIRHGLCDIALAGGADELCRVTVNGFGSLLIADRAPCKPFDRDRRGLNLGEGAAMLVLESEALRLRRGARSRGRVLGYGSACDGHHLTAPHPDGRGLSLALDQALAQAGLAPEDIAFVNTHGTGTIDNDRVESRLLARRLPGVTFLSTKGFTGHTLGAAGAIEAALTLACLKRGIIPGTAGCTIPDPALPASPVLTPTQFSRQAALSFSLAFGGGNAVLLLDAG